LPDWHGSGSGRCSFGRRAGEELTAMGAGGVIADVALAAIEKEAPVIVAAMAPEFQKLLALLPDNTVKVVPPDIGIDLAVAANLLKSLPAFTAAIFKTVKAKVGIAVAIYVTDHPRDDLQGDAAWIDIQSLALTAIADEGLDVTKIERSTIRNLVSAGIELYRAGAGTKALSIGK
jgi:hypothetical protein